jgi:hypothetical protein
MKYLLILAIIIALPLYSLAQASLIISLVDDQNNPIPNQPLWLTNQDIGYSSSQVTDNQGKVMISGLSTSGFYEVEVPSGGFYKLARLDRISLISDKTTSVTLVLTEQVTELGEVIIVADKYLSINETDAEVASELNRKEIERLPVEGRDITRTLYRLPNITQATGFFPEAPNVSINGANGLYTNYQIDGMDNNENFLGGQRFATPVGFVQNITALTNNFSAEHGLTSNGIINITSRSGTNTLSGEAFYVVRPGPALDASSPYAQRDLSGNQVKDGFQRHQAGFSVGGPLVRDQTFFFLNVEHTSDIKDNLLNSPDLGVNETVRGNNRFTFLSAKIDHQWSRDFRSSLRANVGIIDVERQGGGLEGGVAFPSAANTQDRNSLNIAWKNSWRTDAFTMEANYLFGRFRWNYANPGDPDSPNVNVLNPSGQSIAQIGHPGFVFDELEQTHVFQNNFRKQKGQHSIKAGWQIRSSQFELFGGGNPNGSYTVQLTEIQLDQLRADGPGAALVPGDLPADVEVLNYGVELRPNSFTKRQNILSVYVEDQFAITSDLRVNLGIRYDYDNLSKGGGDQGDFNNIGPRLSVNYKLNEKSSFRAGYGIYYDKILYAVYSDALQFNNTSQGYLQQLEELIAQGILPQDTDLSAVTNEGNLVASIAGTQYLQGPASEELQGERGNIFSNELRILNPEGYQNPYSHQFMLGYQTKLTENTLFYVDLMHNRSYNLFRLRDLNAPSPYPIESENVLVRPQVLADQTRPVAILTDAQGPYAMLDGEVVRDVARSVVMTETEGRSNYYAANFTWQKDRGGSDFTYRFMYTLSFLENNTEDINFRAMDSNNFDDEWGPSINDRRHLLNSIVTWFPIDGLSVTLASLIQSGQPINRVPDATQYGGTTDLNGDGRSFSDAYVGNNDRAPGEDRNNDRLPWSNTFDLSVFYDFKINNENRIELGAYVFNLFNAENLSGYANNATQSNQIQPGPKDSGVLIRRNAAPPRQFQFSIRYLLR